MVAFDKHDLDDIIYVDDHESNLDYYNKNNETIKNAKKIKKIYDDNITEITSEEKIEILEYKIKCANNDGYIYNVLDPLMTFYDFLAKVEREG